MAPYPDTTPTETSPPEVIAKPPAEDSALPGMKRGIAIGVVCSVGIIMVALLAFFAYRRRKQQAAKHTKLSPEEPVEMDAGGVFWPQEKTRHVQAMPIEADARTIHELDGSEVPELPGHYEGQELAIKKTPRTSYYAGDDDAYSAKLKQWNEWSIALDTDQSRPPQEPTRNSNPYLEISPSQPAISVSPIAGTMLYIPSQNSSFSVSPIALSPLEDAHVSPLRTDQTRQQRYYNEARTSI